MEPSRSSKLYELMSLRVREGTLSSLGSVDGALAFRAQHAPRGPWAMGAPRQAFPFPLTNGESEKIALGYNQIYFCKPGSTGQMLARSAQALPGISPASSALLSPPNLHCSVYPVMC